MNKKNIIILLIVILLCTILTKVIITGNVAYQVAICQDKDGGIKPYVKGSIYSGMNPVAQGTDTCLDSNRLKEYYCKNIEDITSKIITAGSGEECKNGKIRTIPTPTPPKTCRDTDGGADHEKKGSIYQNLQDGKGEVWKEADYCFKNGQVVQETGIGKGQQIEFYCKGYEIGRLTHNIDSSENCIKGELIEAEAGCEDSDGGMKPETKGSITMYGDQITDSDYCKNSNGQIVPHATSGTLVEFACEDNQKVMYNIPISTNQECKNGALIESEPACEDSDGGKDYYEKGNIYLNGEWKEADYCSNQYNQIVTETKSGFLTEFYCEGDSKKRKTYEIGPTEKCKNGAIILDKDQKKEIATEFPIDAWGFTGWGECKDQQGTWDQVNDYCQSKGYGGAVEQGDKSCYHEYSAQRWGWDGKSPMTKGSSTGGGYAFTKVKCFM